MDMIMGKVRLRSKVFENIKYLGFMISAVLNKERESREKSEK